VLLQAHHDDISNVLILNKKSIPAHETQLFQSELEKFRPHQNRISQANHKQSSLLKELNAAYGALLQDRRVRAEQSKYETITRQRGAVMVRYRKVYQAFNDLNSGLLKAQQFYSDMKETIDSLEQNVETFVNNRRLEGAQLLSQIEQDRMNGAAGQADRERERLRELMERMSMDPSATSPSKPNPGPPRPPPPLPAATYQSHAHSAATPAMGPARYSGGTVGAPPYPATSPPLPLAHHLRGPSGHSQNGPHPTAGMSGLAPRRESQSSPGGAHAGGGGQPHDPYVPTSYARRDAGSGHHAPIILPPLQQPYMASPPAGAQFGGYSSPPQPQQQQQSQPQTQLLASHQYMSPGYVPPGYVPPPPPPGPPPLGPQQSFPTGAGTYALGTATTYASSPPPPPPPPVAAAGHHRRPSHPQNSGDPWAGLNAWR
jgi:hypothetical protein